MKEDIDIDELAPWLLLLITLIGGALRVLLLETKGMGVDETFSVWLASHSLLDGWRWMIQVGQNSPLYYGLFHFWTSWLGETPYYARLFSVLFGTAAIPLLYWTGKRLTGALVGLAAAVLLAFSPFHIVNAQETLPYTFLMFNATAALLALARLSTDPRAAQPFGSQLRAYLNAWRAPVLAEPTHEGDFSFQYQASGQNRWQAWLARHRWLPIQAIETDLAWLAFVAFSTATLLSHGTAFLFLLASNLFVFGLLLFQRARKPAGQPALLAPSWGNWLKAQLAIHLLWLPWLLFLARQASAGVQNAQAANPTWEAVLQTLKLLLNASGQIPANLAAAVWVIYALVLGFGLFSYRKKVGSFLFLAILFAIPLLGEWLISLWRPIFAPQSLIWLTIPLFLLLAAGVAQFRFQLLVLLAMGALATINLFSASDYYRFYQKEDWNAAARFVAGYTQPDDLVLFSSNAVEVPFNYYFQPYATYYSIQVEKRGLPQDLFADGVLEPPMTARDVPGLLALLQGHPRVWLVYSRAESTDPLGLIPQTLAAQKKLIQTNPFYGGQVQLYANP